jgi:hypothetical protein
LVGQGCVIWIIRSWFSFTTSWKSPFASAFCRYFVLRNAPAARRTSMPTVWRRPVFSSQMSLTAVPTPARTAAQVSPILNWVEKTGSAPVIDTSPSSGMPLPRASMTSWNADFTDFIVGPPGFHVSSAVSPTLAAGRRLNQICE